MSRDYSLTAGPVVTTLIRLSLPLLGANLLQQLYNIINSIVVTYYIGDNAFAALGVAESIMNLFIYVISGACVGASVLVARFFGARNFPRLRQELFVAFTLMGGFTLAAVTLGQIFLTPLLRIIHTPEELMGDVSLYLRVILMGMIFTFTYNFLAATLRAIGSTRTALYFLLLSLVYNLAAAWLLVAVLKLGIVGTALATASAQLLSTLLCLLYIRRRFSFLRVERQDMRMDMALIRETVSYSVISALHQSSLYLGKLLIQSAVNALGTASISGFAAATRVENFVQAFGLSGSEAIAIFVAQNRGAGQNRRAMSGLVKGGAILVGLGIPLSALLCFAARPLLYPFLFQDTSESLAVGASYLVLISWFYLFTFPAHAFVGHFRGEGRMNIPFLATTTQIAVRVVGTYLLVDRMGLNAVALATGIGWGVIVVFHSTCFLLEQRGIWPRRTSEA